MNFSAVILAGGPSRRMGRDKAWIPLEGQPLLARQVATVQALDPQELFVSGRPDTDYSAVGCRVLTDSTPGLGPLMGIHAALRATTSPLLVVLAVDMPLMTSEVLETLLARCDGATGVVPMANRRIEPLSAIYPRRAAGVAIRMLALRMRAVRAFAENCRRERLIRFHHVDEPEAKCFVNWNSWDDVLGGVGAGTDSPARGEA